MDRQVLKAKLMIQLLSGEEYLTTSIRVMSIKQKELLRKFLEGVGYE